VAADTARTAKKSSEVEDPESAARRHVGDTDELPQIGLLWYVAGQSTIRQDGNLSNALRHT